MFQFLPFLTKGSFDNVMFCYLILLSCMLEHWTCGETKYDSFISAKLSV